MENKSHLHPEGVPEFLRGVLFRGMDTLHVCDEVLEETTAKALAHYHNLTTESLHIGTSLKTIIQSLATYHSEVIANPIDAFTRPTNPLDLLRQAQADPASLYIIDESYVEYTSEEYSCLGSELPENLLVYRSLSPFYALSGLPASYVVGSPKIIEILKPHRPHSLALLALTSITQNEAHEYRTLIRQRVADSLTCPTHPRPQRRAKSLMIQGLSSDAGKSIITSAFCRIFQQDGLKVAPFKAQNMALNSAVTPEGLEIGRAQAVQAQACKIDPDTRMNPLLLKPHSDTGAQVIVRGKAIGQRDAKDFHTSKEQFFEMVCEAYDDLAQEYDVLVLEGAGSPGEINLKKSDIVNMAMAEYAESAVILVGDIDRGGVYASFLGTYHTFDLWERELTAGFLVNRFRGDASLLGPAHEYLENFTGKPVMGVVPYIADLAVPDEDSVALDVWAKNGEEAELNVALIWLPHISNFTDFAPLGLEPDVQLRMIRSVEDFGSPDLIIIPGSKSVVSDMNRLRENGFEEYLQDYVVKGGRLLGVCGGLQMCGETILDPHAVESDETTTKGFGLLPLTTTLEKEKTLRVETDISTPLAATIGGYEIHHGATTARGCEESFLRPDKSPLGYTKEKVWTTYLHGLFDGDAFRWQFVEMLRKEKGLASYQKARASYDIDSALDRLADVVRASVDMQKIYTTMGLQNPSTSRESDR